MKITIGVKATGTLLIGVDNPGIIKKQWNEAMYRALEAAVALWSSSLVHKKFQPGARTEYPQLFFVRKKVTRKIKWRKWGHDAPLVTGFYNLPPKDRWTIYGAVRRPAELRVIKSRKSAYARWPAPKLSAIYAQEVIGVNKKDAAAMARIMRDSLVNSLRGSRWTKTAIRHHRQLKYRGPIKRRVIRTRLQTRRMIGAGQAVTF